MTHTIAEIAQAIGADAFGDTSLRVGAVREPAMAGPDDLALAMDPKYAAGLAEGRARAAMLWPGADWQDLGLDAAMTAPRPRFAMAGLSRIMDRAPRPAPGIHPSAVVDPSAQLGEGVRIGPLCVIGPEARIGAGGALGARVSVGAGAVIGPGALLMDGVAIGHGVTIGARFIAQPGAIVGGDGFSFVTPEESAVEKVRDSLGAETSDQGQSWARIHSLGSVRIGDDVEIGSNTCIDRGTVRDTVVGDGVKMDNLAQIGHNVVIGRDCLICAQVGIAGSARIGDNVVLGGQTGVSDNVFVGDRVITGGATKVLANVPAGRVMLGYPAMQMERHIEIYKLLRRLPRLFEDVTGLKKAVSKSDQSD